MVHSAKDWPWSSYNATVGEEAKPAWLNTDWLLSGFAQTKLQAIGAYKVFVSEGKGQSSPWSELKNQIFLGDERFLEDLQDNIKADKSLSEIPMAQRRPCLSYCLITLKFTRVGMKLLCILMLAGQ